jgi:hypothetical protein
VRAIEVAAWDHHTHPGSCQSIVTHDAKTFHPFGSYYEEIKHFGYIRRVSKVLTASTESSKNTKRLKLGKRKHTPKITKYSCNKSEA